MMSSRKWKVFLSVGLVCLAMVFILIGPWGMTGIVQAAQEMILGSFTDSSPVQYTDLNGNIIGEGMVVGKMRCVGDNCTQEIEFEPISPQPTTDNVKYEYKFKSRQAVDPGEQVVVVSGTGSIISDGPKIRFTFAGVLQNNLDGTTRITFEASTPEASFIFPEVPGILEFLIY